MRKTVKLLIVGMLLVNIFLLTACGGGSSIESIKSKFKDEGYTTKTFSKADKDKIAGCVDGFSGSKKIDDVSIGITINKFSKKALADEYSPKMESGGFVKSIKGVYVCVVYDGTGTAASSVNVQAAIELFDSCFT